MSATSNIEWTDKTWNPIRGCSRVSPGCERCYAERQAARFAGFYGDGGAGPYAGLIKVHVKSRVLKREFANNGEVSLRKVETREPRWTGEMRFVPKVLGEPLSWKKPAKVFVNSMSDLFHEKLSNEEIAAVFGVMAAAKRHTFQVLTKRPKRMVEWFDWVAKTFNGRYEGPALASHAASHFEGLGDSATGNLLWRAANEAAGRSWPLPNVHIGVSVEDQKRADERIPLLLKVPAALRFLSVEPMLEEIQLWKLTTGWIEPGFTTPREVYPLAGTMAIPDCDIDCEKIDWVIVGGESGPGSRHCNIDWIRSIVRQCKEEKTPVFVKQLGATPVFNSCSRCSGSPLRPNRATAGCAACIGRPLSALKLNDRKGSDMAEWPEDLRVREMPR
jgi:protein gp37